MFTTTFFIALLGIVWIDLLLSGDNAVVIALVCKQLPESKQRVGLIFGTVTAIALRIVLAAFASVLISIPFLGTIAGLFLIWVAVNLLIQDDGDKPSHRPATTLIGAVITIALADAGMSLDNIMAVAVLAHGNIILMALAVMISIPLVITGSAIILSLVGKYPWITTAGALLLGWVAGGIMANDLVRINITWEYAEYVLSASTMLATYIGAKGLMRFYEK